MPMNNVNASSYSNKSAGIKKKTRTQKAQAVDIYMKTDCIDGKWMWMSETESISNLLDSKQQNVDRQSIWITNEKKAQNQNKMRPKNLWRPFVFQIR